jgi:hypothetical protein
MILLVFVVLSVAAPSSAQTPDDRNLDLRGVQIEVVNYRQFWTYQAGNEPPKLTSSGERSKGGTDELAAVLRRLSVGQEQRRNQANEIGAARQQGAKWALASPDGSHVLIGFEDPRFHAMRSAKIVRASDGKTVAEPAGDIWIFDVRWLAGSSSVVILEATERWSYSLKGILGFLVGHPVPLVSFFVRVIDASSGRERRTRIVTDVENAEACVCAESPPGH